MTVFFRGRSGFFNCFPDKRGCRYYRNFVESQAQNRPNRAQERPRVPENTAFAPQDRPDAPSAGSLVPSPPPLAGNCFRALGP